VTPEGGVAAPGCMQAAEPTHEANVRTFLARRFVQDCTGPRSSKMRKPFLMLALLAGFTWPGLPALAAEVVKPIETQYIAALGDRDATSGADAQDWGLWPVDPGPRGVRLGNFAALQTDGAAPAGWKFDSANWWLEEHGLVMEQPQFPIPPGKYVVTGGREKTAVLTISKDQDGKQSWSLDNGASLYDVTHLRCRSARYTPSAAGSCSPAKAQQASFPVMPGGPMPPVEGCNKQDFQVLIVTGMVVDE
jgi:hypothetical protein